MKLRSKTKSLLVSILLVSFILSATPQTTLQEVEQMVNEREFGDNILAGTPHGSIVIIGDGDFKIIAEAESWEGDGSEETPYIIEGFDFDRGGTDGNCIDITDTTAHFVIRNCSFTGATATDRAGISLVNVTNCEVSDNFFFTNYNGMYLDCNNARILNNEFEVNAWTSGISALSLNNSIVSGNTVDGGGGMSGFILWYVESCEISQNTIRNTWGSLMQISYSSNFTISDNEFVNGGQAINYFDTHNSTITRNDFSYNDYGISMLESNGNYVSGCMLENNTNGIRLWDSQNNYIELCEIVNNEERGLEIHATATSNLFKWNTFRNHSIANVIDDGTGNIGDYNYYDDYIGSDFDNDGIGDVPYLLSGTAGNVDSHPLLLKPASPVWDSPPENQNIEFGNSFSYNLEISSSVLIEDWYISDTTHFFVDETGTIRNTDILDVGIYSIDILVTNVYGLSMEGSFTVTVEDSVNPLWISQIQDKSFSYGDDIEIELMAWDLAGIDNWDISDSGNFSISTTSFAENGILTIMGIDNLAMGTYPLTITAYDPSGNYVTATLTVTVTTATPAGGGTDFIVSTAGLGIAIVALIVGVFSLIGSRKSS
ncbi:MAG: right-handed parallel beta-helix repeat-containing protein [Candidatus Thorarchaeota archaeon]|jgi:nitrous oxidase accessory protein